MGRGKKEKKKPKTDRFSKSSGSSSPSDASSGDDSSDSSSQVKGLAEMLQREFKKKKSAKRLSHGDSPKHKGRKTSSKIPRDTIRGKYVLPEKECLGQKIPLKGKGRDANPGIVNGVFYFAHKRKWLYENLKQVVFLPDSYLQRSLVEAAVNLFPRRDAASDDSDDKDTAKDGSKFRHSYTCLSVQQKVAALYEVVKAFGLGPESDGTSTVTLDAFRGFFSSNGINVDDTVNPPPKDKNKGKRKVAESQPPVQADHKKSKKEKVGAASSGSAIVVSSGDEGKGCTTPPPETTKKEAPNSDERFLRRMMNLRDQGFFSGGGAGGTMPPPPPRLPPPSVQENAGGNAKTTTPTPDNAGSAGGDTDSTALEKAVDEAQRELDSAKKLGLVPTTAHFGMSEDALDRSVADFASKNSLSIDRMLTHVDQEWREKYQQDRESLTAEEFKTRIMMGMRQYCWKLFLGKDAPTDDDFLMRGYGSVVVKKWQAKANAARTPRKASADGNDESGPK